MRIPTLALTALAATAGAAAGAEPDTWALPTTPRAVLTDGHDRLYLDFVDRVQVVEAGPGESLRVPVPDRFGLVGTRIRVNREGQLAVLVYAQRTENEVITRRFAAHRCRIGEGCEALQQITYRDSTERVSRASMLGLGISPDGKLGFGVSHTVCPKKGECKTDVTWRCGGSACSAASVRDLQEANLPTPPIARPVCPASGLGLVVGHFELPTGRTREVPGEAMYDKRCRIDAQGRPHIVYHDPAAKAFLHAWMTDADAPPSIAPLDGPESGAANALAVLPDGGLLALGYAYRNPFNKGIMAHHLGPDGLLVESFWLARDKDGNPGRKIAAAASSAGRVLVVYQVDGLAAEAQARLYGSVAGTSLAAVPEAEGWEAEYQDHFFLAGGGATYPFWLALSIAPDAEDGVPADKVFDAKYELASTPVLAFRGEGRYGDFNLGVTYLTSILGDQIEDAAGEIAREAFDWITGTIGWDRLLFYQDVRLEGMFGRMRGRFSDDNGFAPPQVFDSDYRRFTLTLLNAWRIRYGVFYQSYDFHIPVYVWNAPSGSAGYDFVDSFSANVGFHDVGVTVGYSRLDYAAKFEHEVFDWFVDFDAGLGLSFGALEETRMVGGQDISVLTAFMFDFDVEVGLLAYKRFYGLRGFGVFARGGYRAAGDWTGKPGRPDDRKEDDRDSSDTTARFHRFLLQHGPFVDVGLVF